MNSIEFIRESAVDSLAKAIPSLDTHDRTNINRIVRAAAGTQQMAKNAITQISSDKIDSTPDYWISGKLDEDSTIDLAQEVENFVNWITKKLNINTKPVIELSYDTEEAQKNHHTGGHVSGSDEVWVYVKNRNLVDILRTVAHEFTHIKQGELNMIKPGSSYPGSPIELLADMVAGKMIKLYGAKNPYIFQ